jgi:hypothetical protein
MVSRVLGSVVDKHHWLISQYDALLPSGQTAVDAALVALAPPTPAAGVPSPRRQPGPPSPRSRAQRRRSAYRRSSR